MRVRLPNNWKPRAYQWDAWNYLQNGGLHAELVWHRRAGKDELCLNWAAMAAFKRVAGYWHMLPEYAQARKAIWKAVNPHTGKKRIDEAFPLSIRRKTNDQEMFIEFINGSTWQVVGSDNYDSLVGTSIAGVTYSEWALANPNARAYLRPIILENNGWQLFVTSPRGRNHAHRTLQAAIHNEKAFAQVLPWNLTKVFSSEQMAEELLNYKADFGDEYGENKFQQEYECNFDAANLGAILAGALHKLELAGRINNKVVYDPQGAPIEISADIGRRDTSTWWFWQPKIGGYSLIDYAGGSGLDALEWCYKLNEKLKDRKLGKIWLPHDARAKTFAAQHSAAEIFVKKFSTKRVAVSSAARVSDRINAARTVIRQCEFNSEACEAGLNGLRSWSYEYNEENKNFSSEPKHDWASHDGDGFSYGAIIMNKTKPLKHAPKPRTQQEMNLNELFKAHNHPKERV